MIRFIGFAATAATLSACTISAGDVLTPNPPTVSRGDVIDAQNEAAFLASRPQTTFGNLPTGSATYTGQLGADVSGDVNGSILGDMTMNVGFAANTVRGDVRNINLIDQDGNPDQRLDGQLLIDGVETAGQLDAFASGDLSGVDVNGNRLDTQMLLILDGQVRDDLGRGDAVYGTASGQAQGDFNMDVEGVFYGTR